MLDAAKKLLKKYYGYSSFRVGQEKIIKSILMNRDTLAIMPTGGGKSLCFQIPSLLFPGITLVVSPLISLMKDQVDNLNNLGINAAFVNSSLDYKEVNDRLKRANGGEYRLLYIAPERLESQYFCELLKELEVSLLAIDEAHCVSQWGHDFRPSYRSIVKLIDNLPKRPIVAAFTATATEDVREDIIKLLGLQNPNIFTTGFDRENLYFSVVKDENKKDFLIKYINNNKDNSGIVYAATRKEVDILYEVLSKKGYSVGKYHAGLSDEERIKNQEAFLYDDIKIMIATNAFGMGIDKSNVRYVIHYNMPKNMESYYQEAGRGGRDGEPSECILLFSPQDIVIQKFLIDQTISSPIRKASEYKKLKAMSDYCHTQGCLRRYILSYFGEEEIKETCDNCSNCKDDSEMVDITVDAQKILSCVIRLKERYGVSMIADVLKGSKNKKILQLELDRLSTYGLLNHYSVKDIKDIINLLAAEEYLYFTNDEYPVVKLRKKALPVLKGEEQVFRRVTKQQQKAGVNSLFEILRGLRRDIADRENIPPYIIFSDSTLKEMSQYYPTDEDSMLLIKGVGEVKLQRYGDEFLRVIREYVSKHPEVKVKRPQNQAAATENDDNIPSHVISLNMYKSGMTVDEIAKNRGLKPITIQDHIIRCSDEGLDVDLEPFIPKIYEPLIIEAIKKLGHDRLKPIKESLPDEIDYMSIRAVICKYKKALGSI